MIELIQRAIKLNHYNRPPPNMVPHCCQEYAREFCTIHLAVGRCTGKTTAIVTLARKNDLIIVHNYRTKLNLIKTYPHLLGTVNSIEEVISGSHGLLGKLAPRNFDYVWIDEPNLCDDTYDVNQVYDYTRATLYVKLGE